MILLRFIAFLGMAVTIGLTAFKGISLYVYLMGMCSIMLFAASWVNGKSSRPYQPFLIVLITIAASFSLFALNELYHPKPTVLTNANTHILTHAGYKSQAKTIALTGGKQPLFKGEKRLGNIDLMRTDSGVVLGIPATVPIFVCASLNDMFKTVQVDSLISDLPFTRDFFELNFLSGLTLRVDISEVPGKETVYGCSLVREGQLLCDKQQIKSAFIRKSLPLDVALRGLVCPEATIDWSVLSGISLVRGLSGAPADWQSEAGYYLALNASALSSLKEVVTSEGQFSGKSLNRRAFISCPLNRTLRMGSGLYATPYFRVAHNGEAMSIWLDKPIRRRLPSRADCLLSDKELFVTTDDSSLVYSSSREAITYPEATRFSLQLRYPVDTVGKPLLIRLLPTSGVSLSDTKGMPVDRMTAGDTLLVTNVSNPVSNILLLTDQYEEAPFKPKDGFILLYLVLGVAILSWLVSGAKRSFHAEAMAWMLIIAFLTVRSFLAWRIQVIPPLDLSLSAFSDYLSDRYVFDGTMWFIIGLGVSVIVLKVFGGNLYHVAKLLSQRLPGWGLFLVAALFLVLGYLGKEIYGNRLAYVFVPLLVMVLMELVASMRDTSDKEFQLFRILTHLSAIVFTIKFDTGAGIVFLLGTLFIVALRLIGNGAKEQSVGILLFAVLFVGLFGANRIVSLLFTHTQEVLLVVACVIMLIAYFIARKWKAIGKLTACGIGLVIVGGLYLLVFLFLDDSRHIFYRAEIHLTEPDEILREHQLETEDMRRLMQNLENRWFLAYYNEMPSTEEAYIIRPHFHQGVSLQTQKTDVIVSRFVIAEHGSTVVYLLLLALIIAIGVTQAGSIPRLGTDAILLLFMQSLLILMAVTNRFLFFGQDFLLLSMASYLTLLVTGLLMLVFIVSSATPYDAVPKWRDQDSRFRVVYALLPLGLALVALFTDPSLRESGRRFSVKETIEKAENELSFVNERFQRFQVMNGYHFSEAPADVDGLMQRFESETQTREDFAKQASPFTLSLYDLFLRGGARANSNENILHARVSGSLLELAVNHSYYSINPPEDLMAGWHADILAIGSDQKDKLLIQEGKVTQKIEISDGQKLLTDCKLSYDYPIYLASVPAAWTLDGRMRLVAAPKQVPFKLISSEQSPITVSPQRIKYIALQANDAIETVRDEERVLNRSGMIRMQPASMDHYLARFMNVNGDSRWVYPLGSTSLLPMHLSQMFRSVMAQSGASSDDVQLSILLDMQRRVHGILNQYSTASTMPVRRSVIVANGDGQVLSLVTTANPYKADLVNPNDPRQIYELRTHYYMSGNFNDEEKHFSDLNFRYIYPGSSIKPLVTAGLLAKVPELSHMQMFLSPSQQGLTFEEAGRKIVAHNYAGKNMRFQSLTNDEIGLNGRTDMKHFITQSSNFFHSLLVYLGYYQTDYLREQLALVKAGKKSELFRQVGQGDKAFPQFELYGKRYTFDHWLANDPLQMHEHGALQQGLLSLGLSNTFPGNASLSQSHERAIYPLPSAELGWTESYYPYAYPRNAYLPEPLRITRQGLTDGLKGTALGAYPFFITPWKMCELYGRFFSQNADYRLSLDATHRSSIKPLPIDGDESAYSAALKEQLLPGLQAVPLIGTAKGLRDLAGRLAQRRLTIFAKTGTVSFGGEGSAIPESQLLAVVVKRSYQNEPVLEWMRNAPQLVFYFVSEDGKHDYRLIEQVVETALNDEHCKQYLKEE